MKFLTKVLKTIGLIFLILIGFVILSDLLEWYWNWVSSWTMQRTVWSAGVIIALAIWFKDKNLDLD